MNNLEQAQIEYEAFIQKFQSAIIATANGQGIPNASYTPFVIDEFKNIYIYISGLSTHTQNLVVNPHASVMLIEDEDKTEQIFARHRLTFECTATLIERDSDTWYEIMNSFHARFGEIMEVLSGLQDFRMFKLTPKEGRFVIGFGAAYFISGDDLNQLKGRSA
ncbi:HugZ family protein [Pelatocladus sp. BLCC-F211]|uniref:HugZ family pyridoxamine 5'-phosphate oxidase n=1 Tax=Pelatocladus sp. BLCC-F211 TaxID=3342752 RepID=UPI0035B7C42C